MVSEAAVKERSSSRSWLRLILLLCLLSIGLKVLYATLVLQQASSADEGDYLALARNLQHDGTLGTTLRGVGYPAFLALLMSISPGRPLLAIRLGQAVLLGLLPLFVWRTAEPLFGRSAAGAAAILAAFYPPFLFYSGKFLSESFLTFLLAWALMLCVAFPQQVRASAAVAAGAVLAVATLTRAEFLPLPFLLAAALALCWRGLRLTLRRTGPLFLAFFIVLGLGLARNYAEFRRFYLATDFGQTLWLSTYPEDWQEWREHETMKRTQVLSPWERDRALAVAGLRNLRDYPGTYLLMSAKRFFRFWIGSHSNMVAGLERSFTQTWRDGHYLRLLIKGMLLGINLFLLALAGVGLVAGRGAWRTWLILAVPFAYTALVHTFLFSTSRYQIPIMPQVLMFSALGMVTCYRYVRRAPAVLPRDRSKAVP
ncbi:MAG: glycosyltransferase family 39 protein [Candidatus Tectomicrobia bacterium]|nr:glycosyltransferase family 39 protein [Candidatus Tectomicrobia bacterium]